MSSSLNLHQHTLLDPITRPLACLLYPTSCGAVKHYLLVFMFKLLTSIPASILQCSHTIPPLLSATEIKSAAYNNSHGSSAVHTSTLVKTHQQQ